MEFLSQAGLFVLDSLYEGAPLHVCCIRLAIASLSKSNKTFQAFHTDHPVS